MYCLLFRISADFSQPAAAAFSSSAIRAFAVSYTHLDNAVLHCDVGGAVMLGKSVTVGHSALVHGCTVGDGSLIGMHATLLNHCVVGKNCIIGAGALVPEGMVCLLYTSRCV